MKKLTHSGLLLSVFLLSACGQPGPLYLPTDKAPVYVPPEEQAKQEPDTKPDAQKEIKPPPQPPENNQPKEQ